MLLHNMGNASAICLLCWLLLLIGTLVSYFKKPVWTPYLLFGSAVCIAATFALLAPFLYPWDEQFHALVGKNMANDLLVPKLVPFHPLDVPSDSWVNGVVWLHKQPLFTWQIALSVKLFGASAFAVRLPSVLFHGVLAVTIFRMGTIVFNRKTGFVAALLIMHSSFLLGLISGRTGTDHNDYVFLCYITLSFWAWFEWDLSAQKKWLYWLGFFAGCAILTKWLVGLLIFAGWSAVIASRFKRKAKSWDERKDYLRNNLLPFFTSLGICVLVFLPWQIYTFMRFPVVAKREADYNALHITESVENHSGDMWFHYKQLSTLYFERFDFLILVLIGCIALFISKRVRKEHKIFMLVAIGVIYLFFTVVLTKMPGFTVPVMGFVMLIIAFGITELSRLISSPKIGGLAVALLTLIVSIWLLKPTETIEYQEIHGDKTQPWGVGVWYRGYEFSKLHGSDSPKRVVFGVNFSDYAHISWMFFNDELAYPFIPTKEQVEKLQKSGYRVTIVESEGNVYDPEVSKRGIEFLKYN